MRFPLSLLLHPRQPLQHQGILQPVQPLDSDICSQFWPSGLDSDPSASSPPDEFSSPSSFHPLPSCLSSCASPPAAQHTDQEFRGSQGLICPAQPPQRQYRLEDASSNGVGPSTPLSSSCCPSPRSQP